MRLDAVSRHSRQRIRTKAFAAVGTILAVIVALILHLKFKTRLADGITKEGLLAIHPGMPVIELLALIGDPIRKRDDVWIYGMLGIDGNGLEIFVGVSKGIVTEVAVEDHDLGVYWYRENEGPVLWKPVLLDQLPRKRK